VVSRRDTEEYCPTNIEENTKSAKNLVSNENKLILRKIQRKSSLETEQKNEKQQTKLLGNHGYLRGTRKITCQCK
jgi:hypothetical protein